MRLTRSVTWRNVVVALFVLLLIGVGIAWAFRSRAPVAVSVVRFEPADGASDVALSTPITIMFDQPIVLTDTLIAAANDPRLNDALPQPLVLKERGSSNPPVRGAGRWLSPTLYSFAPENGLRAATTYEAAVPDTITIAGQSRVNGARVWSFTSASPLVRDTRPYDAAIEVPVDSVVDVYLAADVDAASAGAHFQLAELSGGTLVTGTIALIDGGFAFRPAAPLTPGVTYEARILPGIQATHGSVLRYQPPAWHFTIIGGLAAARLSPASGAAEVALDSLIRLTFDRPIVALPSFDLQGDLPQPLEITPALPGIGRWDSPSSYVYSPTVVLRPATRYTVRAAAGLRDTSGVTLQQDITWQFTTLRLVVTKVSAIPDSGVATPTTSFQATFSMPIDPDSARAALQLRDAAGAEVRGAITVEGSVATFVPVLPLNRGATYTLFVVPGVRSIQGDTQLAEGYSKQYRIVAPPALAGSTPAQAATDATPGAVAFGGSGLTLRFNVPMDRESVLQHTTIDPQPARAVTLIAAYAGETSVTLDFDLLPNQTYRIVVGAASRDIYGAELGQDQTIVFRTRPTMPALGIVTALAPDYSSVRPQYSAPSVSLSANGRMGAYNAYDPIRITLRHINMSGVAYEIYRLDQGQAITLLSDIGTAWQKFRPSPAALLQRGQIALSAPPDRQWLSVMNLGKLEPGLYQLLIRGPGDLLDYQMMAVSRYALTVKRSADQLFLWAVDLATGRPVADLPLSAAFVDALTIKDRPLGRTDAQGVLQTSSTDANLRASVAAPLYISAPAGESFLFATSQWNSDISASSFGIPAGAATSGIVGNVYTDRPLYRPSQTVYIRGAVRIEQDRTYLLPTVGGRARLTITDPLGNIIFSTLAPLNETGSFSTSLQLEQLASLGVYGIFCELEGERPPETIAAYGRANLPAHHFYGAFTVAEYRKPTFDVAIDPEQTSLLPNSTGVFTISARYFSGEPVADAPLRWYVLDAPIDFASDSASDFHFGASEPAQIYFGPRGVTLESGRTDAHGQLVVRPLFPASSTNHRRALHAEVTDVAGRTVNYGQALINLPTGQFNIGLRPAKAVLRIGETQAVDIITLDDADRPWANQELQVTIARRDWFSAREQGTEGRFYWTSTYSDTVVATDRATTAADGRASIPFTPQQSGIYQLTAEGRDGAGNLITSRTLVYVSGNDVFWGIDDSNQIKLVADQSGYHPGDVAHILVPAPYPGMTALMTIERGKVIEHRTLTITGTTGLLDIPITADYTPNIYISVVLVKPAGSDLPVPELRVGMIELKVPIEQQLLSIMVTPDKAQAGPRDTVTFAIKATDFSGKGVRVELSLALVDQSLLALVKSLSKNPTPTYTQDFFAQRKLGVETANTLVQLVDRVTLRVQPGSKGGAGGSAVFPGFSTDDDLLLRRNFPDTAYWNPSLMTDEQGNARVSVQLPDNLTTWRLVVRGLTSDTRFGQAVRDVGVTRALSVDPVLPSTLLVGDRAMLRALLRNNTSIPITASIALEATGLQLSGTARQLVQLPANGVQSVTWAAEASAAGQASLRFVIDAAELHDALEQTIPIRRYMTPAVTLNAGQVFGSLATALKLPASPATGDRRELVLELVPSLGAAIDAGLQDLAQPTFASTDQIVSSFLPRVAAARLHLPDSADQVRAGDLQHDLTTSLQQLYRRQNLDGGWGWWGQDLLSHPYLTTYVVQGLIEARKAGVTVDQHVLVRAIGYLETSLSDFTLDIDSTEPWRANARSYTLFVLTEAGRTDVGRTVGLYDRRDRLGTYGRAYLLMTLSELGSEFDRVQTLVNELASGAVPRASDVYWPEPAQDIATMSSDTRTTALVVQALARTAPQSPLLPNGVRYLMSQRVATSWRTPQETTAAILALSEYLAQMKAPAVDYGYRVAIGDRIVTEGTAGGAATRPITTVLDTATVNLASADALTVQQRTRFLQRQTGMLYYRLSEQSYPPVSALQPLDHGLRLQKRYLAVDPASLMSTNAPVQAAGLSDLVMIRLTLVVPEPMQYLVVEDWLPAGLEPIEIVPRSANVIIQAPLPDPSQPASDLSYFTNVEFHRDRVALFATSMQRGTYYYNYLARATTAGTFQGPPSTAYQLYQPEVFGRTGGAEFVIRERNAKE